MSALSWVAFAGAVAAGRADSQLEFGVKMARRGLWSEALFRFQQAEDLDASNPRVLNNLAVAYEAVGRFDDALSAYQRALKISPSDRNLKENYARFVEFYQAYKPEGEDGADGEEEADSETPPEPQPDAATPADGG